MAEITTVASAKEGILTNGQKSDNQSLKRFIAIAAAAAVLVFFHFICPVPEGLSRTAMSAVGILLCCIILWVTEAFPFMVTVVLIYVLLPITGVLPFATTKLDGGGAIQSVFNQSSLLVPIYCLFIFAVTAAIMSTPIPYRIASFALKWANGSSKKIVIGLMMATGVFSMFIADLAASAIFVGISLSIVKANGGLPMKSGLGKALMIGIPAAAVIGGIGTPLGNSANMLSINMVEMAMNTRITFLGWCIVNIPLALAVTFVSSLWITKVFKLESITPEAISVVKAKLVGLEKLTTKEVKLIIWYVIAFGLMIASTWVPQINSVLIALIFCVIASIAGGLGVVTTFIPLDPITLIGYDKGYVSMAEWLKKAWAPTIILLVLSAIWIPLACGFAFSI